MTMALDHGAVTVDTPFGRRTYTVDTFGHRVVVADAGTGRIAFTFGRRGSELGSFDVPLDIAVVTPTFYDERPADPPDAWLAVADYGNARVQIFDLDGALVDVLNGEDLDYGWRPSQVTWRAPFLQIRGVEGAGCCIHLAAALLAHAGGRINRPLDGTDTADPVDTIEGLH